MDMSRPISTVIPTLDGPVLAVLARTNQPLTGRRVHQLAAAGSETGTRKVLRRLADTGLVIATEVGASVQYSLNRNHLAAAAVLELTTLRQQLLQRIRAAIEQWPHRPIHASVFGSTARGDGDLHSDVDLLIVHGFADPPTGWTDQVGELAEQVDSWTGNHLQTYELRDSELITHFAAGEPIVNDWLRDSITVYGPDFRQVRNKIVHGMMPR
jgi:predicted nucleotidyltransferase